MRQDERTHGTETIHISVAPTGFQRWPEVLDLLRTSFAYMADRIDPPSSLNRLDLDGLKSKAGKETCLLATDGARIVGCAFLSPQLECLYVGKVAVADDVRGLGVARRLFRHAESIAVMHHLPCLELQTRIELTENHTAFARIGFVRSGEDAHAGYDRPTSIRMRKPVTAPVSRT